MLLDAVDSFSASPLLWVEICDSFIDWNGLGVCVAQEVGPLKPPGPNLSSFLLFQVSLV